MLVILFNPKIAKNRFWHAVSVPLASIIGSGFLVSGPLLIMAVGEYAFEVMFFIVLIAYYLGSSIRFNILYLEPLLENKSLIKKHSLKWWAIRIENLSWPLLGVAYSISIAFYLKLMALFLLKSFEIKNTEYANYIATFVIILIISIAKLSKISVLEKLKVFSVNVKVAILAALIISLFSYNADLLFVQNITNKVYHHDEPFEALQKILGMIIIIQGFETSRYLGSLYPAHKRVSSMRYAQIIVAVIYILFTMLTTLPFSSLNDIDETAIIDMSKVIATFMPYFLVLSAVLSQFSAAIAVMLGGGGLITQASDNHLRKKDSILIIAFTSIVILWSTSIFDVIVLASKAFACYYFLQVLISLLLTLTKQKGEPNRLNIFLVCSKTARVVLFSSLLIITLLIIVLGKAAG